MNAVATRTLAASAATKEEVEIAKQRMRDGSKPVVTEKRPYRPKPTSQYEEPTYLPDDDDTLEVLYRSGGTAISKTKQDIDERHPGSIIKYDEAKHGETLRKSVQWEDCPEQLRTPILRLIKKHWDVFAQEGLKNHIRGFICHIDTGNAQPVCCKLPRYGPHEARVITKLTRGLEENGLIEDARSPWGAQVVLAAKPNQDHVHWSEYIWRLTVSYRQLNTVTRPFIYPSRRCDDAARDIGRPKHFITMDFESGFWQVLLHETSRDKTAFFVPDGQKRWTVMPMGCLNAHGTFCCLVDTLKRQWNRKATEQGIRDDIEVTLKGERPWTDAEVIVDDIMLHSENTDQLIKYFEVVLQVLEKHQVTVKLKKCRFFPQSAEFVGMDIEKDGNRPARSKMQALQDLKSNPPKTLTDLRQIIGLIGFYQDWIANYELRIGRWRQHIKQLKGTKPTESEIAMDTTWTEQDTKLLNELLDELTTRPTLARPDYTRRFYLKTDWCRLGMAAILLQADPDSTEAAQAEKDETERTKPCSFDKHMHHLRLRPIAFSSRKCSESEGNMHSYTGEAATGVWAIEKYKRHLFGKEFTWMTDCNGLRQFFEGEDVPTHMHQRMRQRLLRFLFTIVHRPARFMVECDVLTRYNNATSQWRPNENKPRTINTIPIGTANQPIEEARDSALPRTLLAEKCNVTRTIWQFNAGTSNVQTTIEEIGVGAHIRLIEERPEWRNHPFDREHDDPKLVTIQQLEETLQTHDTVDWIVTQDGREQDSEEEQDKENEELTRLIQLGERHGTRAIVIFTRPTLNMNQKESQVEQRIQQLETNGWSTLRAWVKASRYGAAIATTFTMILAMRNVNTLHAFHMQGKQAMPMSEMIDDNTTESTVNENTGTEIQAMQRRNNGQEDTNEPKVAALVQRKGQHTRSREWITAWTPCYDTDHPGPDLQDTSNQWFECPFAIETNEGRQQVSIVRGIRQHELINLIGYDEDSKYRILQQPPETAITQLRNTPPVQLLAAVLHGIYDAETKTTGNQDNNGQRELTEGQEEDDADEDLRQALSVMLAHEFQQTTAIPLPTMAQWQDATAADEDLNTLVLALRHQTPLQREQIQDAALYKLWQQRRLEEENGILFHTGLNTATNHRHVRTKIPPPTLRQAIFSALHASPMAGHTGFQKTFWKIAARYFWPNMAGDVKQLTIGCGHCNAANVASHEAQQQLQTFETDEPFDVITLDVWHPGKAAAIKKGGGSHVVTCIEAMTGFATATFVDSLDSETMTKAAFTAFFITHGLPRLVVIDSGSEFAGALQTLCGAIGIPHYTVSKGNHKAIICERFHRYLNKVQKIHAANCETFQDFMYGTIFAVYAWNSAPVDGTNVVRSYAAIGREFPFPIDFERDPIIPRDHEAQGQQALEHIDSAFPLWRQQQAILKILVKDRREHHRRLKNDGRNMKEFNPGDLVVVKKQVQTTQEKGPAKARMQARGPYRILEQIKPGTYKIQRLPGIQGAGRRGRVMKESSARLTKIPSTLVLHKPAAGVDTRLATYRHAMVDNPLENILGLNEPGRYRQVAAEQPFAYERIEDMWQEDIEEEINFMEVNENDTSSDDDESSDDEDNNGDDNHRNPNDADEEHGTKMTNNEADEEHGTKTTNSDEQTGEEADKESDVSEQATHTDNRETENDKPPQERRQPTPRPARTTTTGTQRSGRKRKHEAMEPQRTSKRNTKLPARYQTEETRQSETKAQERQKRTTMDQAHRLYKRIRKSRDKLIFIKYTIDTTNIPRWYVVQAQINDDDTQTTRDEGKYTVRFFIREHTNSKQRQLRNCRYWPEIHELRPNGTLGKIVPIRPGKVEYTLNSYPHRYKPYEQVVNLLECTLTGPFDFAVPKHYQNEAHRIAFEDWEDMKAAAAKENLDVTDIEEIIPLH